MNDIRDRTPLLDVRSFERDEFRCLVKAFTLSDDELMEGVDIHEFIVRSIVQILLLL
jgi:hypothetical protein